MVAKKKAAPAPEEQPAKAGWGKAAPTAPAPEFNPMAVGGGDFDPARAAAAVSGGTPGLAATADENAQFETGEAELAQQQGRPAAEQPEQTPAPTPQAGKRQGKVKDNDRARLAEGVVTPNVSKELVGIIEAIERLMEERAGVSDDIKDKMGFAKSLGYNTAIIRQLLKRRTQDPVKLKEMEALFQTYANAAGMDI